MATRCLIIMDLEDERTSQYSHSDGYPSYMFANLTANYVSPEILLDLRMQGDIGFLDTTIETSKFYNRDRGENTSTAYHGMDENVSTIAFENGNKCCAEYAYYWNGSFWKYVAVPYDDGVSDVKAKPENMRWRAIMTEGED